MKIRYWIVVGAVMAVAVGVYALPHLVQAYCPGGNSCDSGHAQT